MNTTLPPDDLPDSQLVPWHNIFVATITFVLGLLGISWNALAMWIVLKSAHLRNSFGNLCFSHCVANTGVLIVFFLWVTPMTILLDDSLSSSRLGRHLGQINILFWDACVYSHLAISINRLLTIMFPLKASAIFSPRNTMFILAVVWSLGTLHSIPYFWVSECFILYTPSSWTWDYAKTECGSIISTYFDYYTGVSVFILITCIDLTTLVKLRMTNNAIFKTTNSTPSVLETYHQRRRTEIRFFFQTCVQGALFFYELLNFYFVSTLWSNPLYVYFTTTFAWELCHSLDGLVVILFHFRQGWMKRKSGATTMTNTRNQSRSHAWSR